MHNLLSLSLVFQEYQSFLLHFSHGRVYGLLWYSTVLHHLPETAGCALIAEGIENRKLAVTHGEVEGIFMIDGVQLRNEMVYPS